jgi:hypothetical protein
MANAPRFETYFFLYSTGCFFAFVRAIVIVIYVENLSDRLNLAWKVGEEVQTRLSLLWMMG